MLVFGLYFSGLLALAYAPAQVTLQQVGRNLVSRITGASSSASNGDEPPAGTSPTFAERVIAREEVRTKLEAALQINLATTETFKSSVAIFTPLAGSLVALLLGTGS